MTRSNGAQPEAAEVVVRDNRLARFSEWLRDAPIFAGLWLLDRSTGG